MSVRRRRSASPSRPLPLLVGLLLLAPGLARAQDAASPEGPAAPQEGAAPRAGRATTLALLGATVHPISGPSLPGATVLVIDGRVAAVGEALEVPADAVRIDLTGKHLYPGLIDADTVLGLTEVGSVAGPRDTNEVGQINPNLRAELAVNPDSELLPVARTGGVLLAHVAPRSGLIAGTSAVIYTAGWTYEDMTVRAPVFLHVRWPRMTVDRSGRAKEKPKKQVEAREEALEALRQAFRDARGYWRAREALGAPTPGEDPKWDALRPLLHGAAGGLGPESLPDVPGESASGAGGALHRPVRVSVAADGLAEIQAALAWAEEERVGLVLVGGADAWRAATALRVADVPVILGPVEQLPRREYEAIDAPYTNAARLHAAGVRFAFSTGGNGFAAANARNLRHHAALAVAYGLPADVALRAMTLGAAELLGVAHRLGSIEPGKDATLIATDAPLLDFRAQVTEAWIVGRPVSLQDRHQRLYERYQERPRR